MISIIIPIYNAEKTLKRCLDSIQKQSFPDYQAIMVNDGSSDKSEEICRSFSTTDDRFQYYYQENSGVSAARNFGIDVAAGEYISFCDSDDYLEPDFFELLLRTAENNPDCGHIWSRFHIISGDGEKPTVPKNLAEDSTWRFTLKQYMSLHEDCLDTSPWNKLFRADIIRNSKIRFSEGLSLGEDWLFNLDYIDASGNDTIAVITKPIYNYLQGNGESLDSKYRSDLLEIDQRLMTACYAHLKKWDVPQEQMDKFYNSCFYMNENILRNTLRAPDMSLREKIRWNSAFMKSAAFREILEKRTCFVHPMFLAAYRSGNYSRVIYSEKLSAFKRMIRRGAR